MNLYCTQLPIHPYHHHPSPFPFFFLLAFTHRLFLPSLLFYLYYFKSLVIRGSLLYSFLHPSSNYLHCICYLHNINFNYYIIFAQKRPSLYYYILPSTPSHYIVLHYILLLRYSFSPVCNPHVNTITAPPPISPLQPAAPIILVAAAQCVCATTLGLLILHHHIFSTPNMASACAQHRVSHCPYIGGTSAVSS